MPDTLTSLTDGRRLVRWTGANVAGVPAAAVHPLGVPGDCRDCAAAVQPEAVGYLVVRWRSPGVDVGDHIAGPRGPLVLRQHAPGGVGDVRAALEVPAVGEEGELGHRTLEPTADSGVDDGCADVAAED